MPVTKKQGIIFSLIMSYAMAVGMEVYNVAIRMGLQALPGGFSNMTNAVFLDALKEASFMGLIVFAVSGWYGTRIGGQLSDRLLTPQDTPIVRQLLRQACTVGIMCPSMSLIASILFNIILGGMAWNQLIAIWVGTLLKNFPMAFFWNAYAASPLTRRLFRRLFPAR
jgi:hypothetical protein